MNDDELFDFELNGAPALPQAKWEGYVENNGARIWCATLGEGEPVLLLHGGLGHSGNWGKQVPFLVDAGYQVIVMDSRGHGRSTRDEQRYTYELMASDAISVLDKIKVEQVKVVGWSDGACIALILGIKVPNRISGVFFFACNMDPTGTKPMDDLPPIVFRCLGRHQKDYALLSPTPEDFGPFTEAVGVMMKTEPNYSADDLAAVSVPVTVAVGEHDEFIKREHEEYLAATIPGARFVLLSGVSHFAPIQRPALFNQALLDFLR